MQFNTTTKYILFLLISGNITGYCRAGNNFSVDFLNVEMACNSTTSDYGNILFQLQITNQTELNVRLIFAAPPNNEYAGFYLLSDNLKSGALKLAASDYLKKIDIEKGKKQTIWLSIDVAGLDSQFKPEYQRLGKLNSIKDFLSSASYKLVYFSDKLNDIDKRIKNIS